MNSGQSSRLLVAAAGTAAILLIVVIGIAMWRDIGNDDVGRANTELTTGANFDLPRFDGSRFVLADYDDQPVFLYFWASWCAPCEEEAPLIQQLWPEYEARGYTFVGVNIQDGEESARAFVDRHGLTFPIVLDRDGTTYLDYGVYGVPEAFFLRPGLELEQKYIGPLAEGPFREHLEAIGTS